MSPSWSKFILISIDYNSKVIPTVAYVYSMLDSFSMNANKTLNCALCNLVCLDSIS